MRIRLDWKSALLLVLAGPPGAPANAARAGEAASAAPPARVLAEAILEGAGIRPGPALCVHLACGDGRLTAELARTGKFLVQGLSSNKTNVAKARKNIQAAGLQGQASVMRASFQRLPYSDNLVHFLVAEDLPKLLREGLTLAEILRVLCPLGTAYLGAPAASQEDVKARLAQAGVADFKIVRRPGLWFRIRKPWPKKMGEWKRWGGGAQGNPVSQDALAGPPARIRWLSDPRWAVAGGVGQVRLSAQGRLFYSGGAGIPGIQMPKNPVFLIARDAFTGQFLWKRPFPAIRPRDSHGRGNFPVKRTLVASGERVFAVLETGKPLLALDARTGKTLMEYRKAGIPREVLFHNGILLLAGGGPVRALDPEKGTLRWSSTFTSDRLIAGGGKLFFQSGPETLCLEVASGKELWRAALGAEGTLRFYRQGILFFRDGPVTQAVSAEDGKRIWRYEGRRSIRGKGARKATPNIFFLGGLCWNLVAAKVNGLEAYVGLDPLTGKEKKRWPLLGTRARCYPDTFSENFAYITDFNCIDMRTGAFSSNNFARPSCGIGGFISNGLYYPFIQTCMCYPMLRGMLGLAPSEADPPKNAPATIEPRFEKGPAYGVRPNRGVEAPSPGSDWPTYRHDAFRSGSSKGKVAAACEPLWTVKRGATLNAPVIAAGRVYAAAVNAHQVFALEAKTGRTLWTYTAEGRMDTPPTIYQGLCLFGSQSGWVTCLRAADGALVWRFRAAPEARQIMAFEQLESPWPVHGSILLQKGTAFFAAGRASDADGGVYIYGLDPHTGTIRWQKRHETRSWSYKLDPETGKFLWLQPRRVRGASVRPSAQRWTLARADKMAQRYFFTKGGAYKIQPKTGRIAWMTDSEIQAGPGKAALKSWSPASFRDVYCSANVRLRELLIADLPVGDADRFHIKSWSFAHRDGASRYSGGGKGLRSVRGGATLLDNVNSWRCYDWMSHKQYYGDGRPLVYDERWVYGARAPAVGQSRFDLLGKGAKVYAWPKAPLKATPGNPRRKKKKKWEIQVPLRVLAMAATPKVIFIAGVRGALDTQDPWGALEGRKGGELWALSAADGKVLHKQRIAYKPVFDGLAAAGGRLYLAASGGHLICFGEK